ncbi:uncharacterized protein FOMMEDRAFT_146600 [Fomitiporia mediterranea MF3/22]|uniref:uncharacterized protein n=1 Tax=Fomitiporia mediterranea (strain MF3/22) TaxID=694068 RepID=UPI0004409B95|nr:uncharacterized protein FOMMEDRAFT_146600 [Fomitiporia mediterranea MF3/22]EJD02750.1 hypothetical protein FOMMEDRAFT_146600 [Fomitiporia mediterranea MF3/22]
MERVQFQQEQMLAELKDLVQKGLFSQNEIKQIMKKRTAFETALVRRIPKKSDFLRYAAYEMNLEALRKKRAERLHVPKGPPTISDYALIRRQFQVFERALKKFKDDLGLWIQYIQAAQRAKARALVSRICGRALQLHPNSPALYILAASHELNHLSHSAARVLLQRGIRLNGDSVELWREYLKMELGFVESLRRRWDVLGLKVQKGRSSSGEDASQEELEVDHLQDNPTAKSTKNPSSEQDIGDDEQARKEILNGALVRTVISSAIKAIPTSELFNSTHSVLTTYPCPPSLRRSLLDHFYSSLHEQILSTTNITSPSKTSKSNRKAYAQAARLYASRNLEKPDLEGEAIVDALQIANEDLMGRVRLRKDDEIATVYTEFTCEWFEKDIDEHLNLYLVASLQSLCLSVRSSTLYATHLHLLFSPKNPNPISSAKVLKLARKYAAKYHHSTSRSAIGIDEDAANEFNQRLREIVERLEKGDDGIQAATEDESD